MLNNIKREFVKRTLPNRLNPITHKEHKFHDHNKPTEKPVDILNFLDPLNKNKEEATSEVSETKQELKARDPDYYNLLYHDTDSQLGVEDRYVSENRAMGRDAKHFGTNHMMTMSPRSTIINKKFKNKKTIMTVFPSYGVKSAKDPYQTTNQDFAGKKTGQKLDIVERDHFRQVYDMKTYMEEMLKAKNMRGEKK
uniref:Uncharacterized protein n=1 Tax=Euplotes harpa TaxID=151035 RepID=A0A7S3JNB3_9SPIT|mmetsp:Transcript_6336/g.7269  ORF Transcript_6336/g.7269 Transcript_6336/m.7269 type:complete len:195 (+) Transcript_6336:288-872(+)